MPPTTAGTLNIRSLTIGPLDGADIDSTGSTLNIVSADSGGGTMVNISNNLTIRGDIASGNLHIINIQGTSATTNANELFAHSFFTNGDIVTFGIGGNGLFEVETAGTFDQVDFTLGDGTTNKGRLYLANNTILTNGTILGNALVEGDITLGAGQSTTALAGQEQEYTGTVTLKDGATMTANAGTLKFHKNWLSAPPGNPNDKVVLTNGGTGDFHLIDNFNVTGGTLQVSSATPNTIKVDGNGMTLSADGIFDVDTDAIANINDEVNGGRGDLHVARNNGIILDGTVNARDMVVKDNVIGNVYNTATSGGTMNLSRDFTVENGADAYGNAAVKTIVEAQGKIYGKYHVAGTANDSNWYKNGLVIGQTGDVGELIADDNATITTGNVIASNPAGVTVNSSIIQVATGKTLSFYNPHSGMADFDFNGPDNYVSGKVDLVGPNTAPNPVTGGYSTKVNNADVTFTAANWKTKDYKQFGGNVILNGRAAGTANILDTVSFSQNGGQFEAVAYNSNVNVSGPSQANITGGAWFSSVANFLGGANFDNSTFKATQFADSITGTNTKNLQFRNNSTIDLTDHDLTTHNFGKVIVDDSSNITLGLKSDSTNTEFKVIDTSKPGNYGILDSNLEKTLRFDQDLLNAIHSGVSIIGEPLVDAKLSGVNGASDWTKQSLWGDYNLHYDGVHITSLADFDRTNFDDPSDVKDQIDEMFGGNTSLGYAQSAVDFAQGNLVFAPTLSGELNEDLYRAMAGPNHQFDFNGTKGVFDKGFLQLYNGSNLANPVYISRDVTRNLTNTLFSRTDAYRRVTECVTANCSTALANANVLNDRYLNRIWVGGLGDYQNAADKDFFSGYKYKAGGLQLGYDRAFGAMIAGVSASYIRGNYEDKAAFAHDSKIENWAFDAYATYNFSSGFFATVAGGYTYSKNNLRELYGVDTDLDLDGGWVGQKNHTNTWWASGKIGYDIEVCDNFSISPSLGVNWWDSRGSAYNANLNGTDFLNYSGIKTHGVELPVEVRVAYDINFSDLATLTLEANGGYAYNFTDNGVKGMVTDLDVNNTRTKAGNSRYAYGRDLGHNSWYAGAGVKFRYDHWDMGVKYDYYGRSAYQDHRVTAQVGYSF